MLPASPPARPAEPVEFAETVPEIVAQLRTDPVLVEDIMSNGHTAEVKAALDAKVEDARVPVFVVLTRTPSDLTGDASDEQLVSLLHARLQQDGIYYVATSQGHGQLGVWGDLDPAVDDDATAYEHAHMQAMTQVREAIEQPGDYEGRVDPAAVAEAGVALDLAATDHVPGPDGPVLSEGQVEAYTAAVWTEHPVNVEPVELPSAWLLAMVATAVGLTVGVVAYRLLQALTAGGGRGGAQAGPATQPATAQDLARLRGRVDREVARIDRRLSADTTPSEAGELARRCREAAERLRDADDVLDVVGALVLARTGAHALGGKGTELYRCCYFNPLHGRGDQEVDLGDGLSLPTCGACRRALRDGGSPDALVDVRPWARDQPYYDGDTVWARTGFGTLDDRLWHTVAEARR